MNIKVLDAGAATEVGDMAEALGVFQENAREMARLADSIAEIDKQVMASTRLAQAAVVQREETEDISRNSREAAVGTNDVSREIEGVHQAAASNGEASGTLVQTSDKLSQDFNDLNRTVQGLIEQIRAA